MSSREFPNKSKDVGQLPKKVGTLVDLMGLSTSRTPARVLFSSSSASLLSMQSCTALMLPHLVHVLPRSGMQAHKISSA
jgi:hypothetical protein